MKRLSAQYREENYEHVLMCLICRSLFDDYDHQPKFLPCHHTFCKDCLKEYIKQTGDEIECPSCRKIATIPSAGVTALQTNFYVKYIQGLVQGSYGGDRSSTECSKHSNNSLTQYCKECQSPICAVCCLADADATTKGVPTCAQHERVSLTTITEECHQSLDTSFSKANALIERKKVESEALLKALCQEKDEALLKIDSTFEQHVHTLSRRATLLKNKVIDIYNEHVTTLENDLEEIATAMTCVVSLKEYHEEQIGHLQFNETEKGISELEEVFQNIEEKIKPAENHILFEDKHGVEKFRISAKDVGRVKSAKPTVPRTEPEGGRDTAVTPVLANSDSEFSPMHAASGGYTAASMCDKMTTSFHQALVDNSEQPQSFQCGTGPVQQQRPNHNTTQPKSHDLPTLSNIIDANANTNGENNCPDPNSNKQGQLIVRPKNFDTTKTKFKKEKSNAYSKVVKGRHFSGKLLDYKLDDSNCNSLLTNTNHGQQNLFCVNEEISATVPSLPDLEALKKADRTYHQLVYTSYDEEELLKELKANRITLNDPNLSFVSTGCSNISESDSWMTASSVEDMVLSTGEDTQQSSL